MENENQLKGEVMRYISQMFAVLRRLFSKPPPPSLCLNQSVKPSAGDQHAKSTGDKNLLTQGFRHTTDSARLRMADTLSM